MKQLVKQTCWRRCATVVLFLLLCLPFCMAQALVSTKNFLVTSRLKIK